MRRAPCDNTRTTEYYSSLITADDLKSNNPDARY